MSRKQSTNSRSVAALWANLRLVVVDTETAYSRSHGKKVVGIGIVTCRNARIMGRWDSLVNPGVAIDAGSTRIHGLRDEDVETAPAFTDIAATVVQAFTPQEGERLIVVAHNVSFDIPLIRREVEAAGLTMPDVAVLDTMGPLKHLAEVKPSGQSLDALLEALSIPAINRHDALADAEMTAQAVCMLLERVADRGHLDIDGILTELEAGTTRTQAAADMGGREPDLPLAPALTEPHLTTHARPLKAEPAPRTLNAWTTALIECGTLRCSHADARVSEAKATPELLLPAIDKALRTLAAADDGPGVATIIHAATPVIEQLWADEQIRVHRRLVFELFDAWKPLLDQFTRCTKDLCPSCRIGEPCGLDTWLTPMARAAVGKWVHESVWSFLPYTGIQVRTGKSVWRTWTEAGRQPLADEAAWLAHEWWRDAGQSETASALAAVAWDIGVRHPILAEARMSAIAVGGRPTDLRRAIAIADEALAATHHAGPPEHWRALRARRTRLAGYLARTTAKASLVLDEDGNPVPVRRHHPTTPRRTRPTRFLRTFETLAADTTETDAPNLAEADRDWFGFR